MGCGGYESTTRRGGVAVMQGDVWKAWEDAVELENASRSLELSSSSDNGRRWKMRRRSAIWFLLHHLLALAKPTDGREVAVRAVRRCGGRESKCGQGKDGKGRRWQELQVTGQRLWREREGRRRGGDVVPGS